MSLQVNKGEILLEKMNDTPFRKPISTAVRSARLHHVYIQKCFFKNFSAVILVQHYAAILVRYYNALNAFTSATKMADASTLEMAHA